MTQLGVELADANMSRPHNAQSPTDLIDTSNFTIDFTGRKSINIGLDPSNDFNVSIQIITPSRFVCLSTDFLRRIYSLMGNILSIISDPPVKSRERLFLKDETITLSKTSYRGDNMLAVESHHQQGCRVLLSRRNLLKLQDMQWIINETVALKSNIIRDAVIGQTDLVATYLNANVHVEKTSTVEEIIAIVHNIHNDLATMNIVAKNENNFTNQIKLFAYKQLAQRWFKKMHENGKDCINDADGDGGGGGGGGGDDIDDWPISLKTIDGSTVFSYTNY
ncbi:uncharacterized protein LOC132932470 [Rhopalosiphum padi]|uniref:uncharacterized protein LOC132926604 n=1 Tax=Rhopalosiphum padi TaxID=40932 RepID=UPI00298E2551|nr:uncharacterized protein LOC132926604 [Rhopalosiphum padi]XP_060854841.1 uncharacterized protein LOC132932470 [Rhopalosiphum padi]